MKLSNIHKLFDMKNKKLGVIDSAQLIKMPRIRILPQFLKLIKDGKKKGEIRSWYRDYTDTQVGLVLTGDEENKIRLVVKFGQILDIRDVHPDDKEIILDDCCVPKSFREKYDCNYVYCIDEVYTVQ